jgi:hypothetical protein
LNLATFVVGVTAPTRADRDDRDLIDASRHGEDLLSSSVTECSAVLTSITETIYRRHDAASGVATAAGQQCRRRTDAERIAA